MRLAGPVVLIAALAAPAQASAAPLLQTKLQRASVRYGNPHTVTGTLLDGTTPLGGRPIVLEGRRYPYDGSYRVIERATTAADGTFTFEAALDRNHRLQVTAPAQSVKSDRMQAYTLPDIELSFRAVEPGVVRLYQRYTVPKQVRLTAPTLFYLGSGKAKRAALRRTGNLRRVRAGKYSSQATIRLPAGWNGRFQFASCFRASTGSGMGDPGQSCPRLRYKF